MTRDRARFAALYGQALGIQLEYYQKILRASPLAYWPLWETSGTAVNDLSGNSYNGLYKFATLNGSTFINSDPCPTFGSMWIELYSAGFASAFG